MTFYIILAIAVIFLSLEAALSKPDNRRLIEIFLFLSLFLIAAFRYEVGSDFDTYRDFYINPAVSNDAEIEFIYFWFVGTLKLLRLPSVFFFGFTALASLSLIWNGMKKHGDFFYISLMLFVLIGLYTESFNIVRHFIALGIIFNYGYDQLKKRNLKGYLLVVCIAGIFHMSAFFCLPFYFLVERRISFLEAIIGMVIAFALNSGFLIEEVTTMASRILPGKYAGYVQYLPDYISALDEPFWIKLVNNADKMLICFFLFKYRGRLITINPRNNILINLAYFNLVFALFSRGIGPLQRLGFYFSIFSVLSIPLLINLGNGKSQRIAIGACIIGAYFVYFIAIILSKNVGEVIPYQTIFN